MTDPLYTKIPESDRSLQAPALFEPDPPVPPSGWRAWLAHPNAPFVAGGGLILVVGIWLLMHFGFMRPLGAPNVVTFDPVRFMNAQRAAASILAQTPNADLAFALTQVARQSDEVIREEARGAIVIVRQAVVAPQGIEDITDAVIQRFGLSTNVPTVTTDVGDELVNLAPTNSSFSRGKLDEDYRLELEMRELERAAIEATKSKHEKVVP